MERQRRANSPYVLYVIGSLAAGGTEQQLSLLARHLHARGVKVRVFSLEDGGSLAEELKATGVEVVAGGYQSTAVVPVKILQLLRALIRLCGELFWRRPQVLHACLPLTGFMGAVAGRLCRVPRIVVARRALGRHQDRHPWWRPADRLAVRLAHAITANAHAVAEDAARRDGVPLGRIHILYNGIDAAPFAKVRERREAVRRRLRLAEGDLAIVNVANLIPYKGHADLLTAFARVRDTVRDVRLVLVGEDRGIGADLRRRVQRLGVSQHVDFLGARRDVAELLAAMDLAVCASHEEGLSNAVLEYLAAGLPVIATAVGGNPEILAGVPGCRLVPARDPQALADALIAAATLAGSADDAARLSLEAQARMSYVSERFSVAAMVSGHLEIYGLSWLTAGWRPTGAFRTR